MEKHCLCGTFPILTNGGHYPLPVNGVRTFLPPKAGDYLTYLDYFYAIINKKPCQIKKPFGYYSHRALLFIEYLYLFFLTL